MFFFCLFYLFVMHKNSFVDRIETFFMMLETWIPIFIQTQRECSNTEIYRASVRISVYLVCLRFCATFLAEINTFLLWFYFLKQKTPVYGERHGVQPSHVNVSVCVCVCSCFFFQSANTHQPSKNQIKSWAWKRKTKYLMDYDVFLQLICDISRYKTVYKPLWWTKRWAIECDPNEYLIVKVYVYFVRIIHSISFRSVPFGVLSHV